MGETQTELQQRLTGVGKKLETPPSDEKELLVVLEEAESLLLKVEQSPSTSMSASLRPVVDALVAKEYLSHSNVDVKVSVASCISEITRITAPDAPYNDELMKDVFELIVEAFKGLDDILSPSFSKRLSILETVAKVRSCVVMLDLECDGLILDMFRNFLATIRDSHSENVFSLMETIMTLVLEESEEISSELLSCLLISVKNDNKDILPIAQMLAEKVIGNCSARLKSNLLELIQSTGTSLTDYSRIVVSICQDNPDLHENNNHNTSGQCLEEDSKLSERTISEEMQQGPGGKGSEACYEIITTSKPTKAPTSNGAIHAATIHRNVVEVPSKRKNHKKGAHGYATKEKNKNTIASPNVADARPRRGRPPGSKTLAKKTANSEVDHCPALQLKKISVKQQPVADAEPTKGISTEKQVQETSDSEEKPLRHMGKKGLSKTNQEEKALENICSKKDGAKSDSEARSPRLARRMKEKSSNSKSSKKSPMHRGRSQKENNVSKKDVEGEQTLKEMASTPKTRIRSSKDENKSKERLQTTSTKKRGRGKVVSKFPATDLDEKLVGSHIQVWWPEDKMFYPGVVDTYHPSTKKHKVLYNDGEIEVLHLKNERWEFINEDKHDVKDGDAHALDSHDMPSKKSKVDPGSTTKLAKADTSLKRNASSTKLKGDISSSKGKSVGSKRKLSERTGDPSREDLDLKSDSESAEIAGKTGKSSKQKDHHKSEIGSKAGAPKTGENDTPKNKDIDEESGDTSKKQNSHSIENITEGSTRAGRKTTGTSTAKSVGRSGGPTKGMLSSEIEEDSNVKTKSNSRNRRRTGRS